MRILKGLLRRNQETIVLSSPSDVVELMELVKTQVERHGPLIVKLTMIGDDIC